MDGSWCGRQALPLWMTSRQMTFCFFSRFPELCHHCLLPPQKKSSCVFLATVSKKLRFQTEPLARCGGEGAPHQSSQSNCLPANSCAASRRDDGIACPGQPQRRRNCMASRVCQAAVCSCWLDLWQVDWLAGDDILIQLKSPTHGILCQSQKKCQKMAPCDGHRSLLIRNPKDTPQNASSSHAHQAQASVENRLRHLTGCNLPLKLCCLALKPEAFEKRTTVLMATSKARITTRSTSLLQVGE